MLYSLLFTFNILFICRYNIWRIYLYGSKSVSFTNTITINTYIHMYETCLLYADLQIKS